MKIVNATATGLLIICAAACGDRSANERDANGATVNGAANSAEGATGNAGNGSAASFCQFTRAQVRNWHASISHMPPNPGQLLVVTGEAQVQDPRYKAQLSQPEVAGGMLRLWLTQAEASGPAPADGWHSLRYEMQNPGAITRVVIWCDVDAELLSIPVETPQ
jgi:hypothetical protein